MSNLRSASTARTYPVGMERLRSAIEEAVKGLPRWTLTHSSEGDVRAVRKARVFGFEDDVAVRFASRKFGVRAEFESASRIGIWDIGQNERNLRELIGGIDRELLAARRGIELSRRS